MKLSTMLFHASDTFSPSHVPAHHSVRGSITYVLNHPRIPSQIDLILSIAQSPVVSIDAVGVAVLSHHHDIANVRFHFENGCIANASASRASLNKERTLRIFQENSYISVDLQNKVLSTHRKSDDPQLSIVTEHHPVDTNLDVLAEEIKAFVHSVKTHERPLVTGIEGRDALKTALAIMKVIK